ncbi:hypothetical protein ABI59_03805 [Acidobacteria bacterium Mor1]|nr:hypothetical protein ABI59_03805 [Acidobacteria bacterium Mor1]
MSSAPEKPLRHPETAFRTIGDEGGLVVMSGRQEVKVLNPAAIKIFTMLDGEHSREQIAEAIAGEFDVSAEDALKDVNAFIDDLAQHGMLNATP